MSARHWSHFILGGARSGKSRYALTIARSLPHRVAFVATGQAGDADMEQRIARHRAERPPDWLTVEEPLELTTACRRLPLAIDLAIVDCLTLWVANRLLRGDPEAAIRSSAQELARLLGEGARDWIIVSNEVGEGVHPPTESGLRFREVLGLVNQQIAAATERVTLMVAGLPLHVKVPDDAEDDGGVAGFPGRTGQDVPQQAP